MEIPDVRSAIRTCTYIRLVRHGPNGLYLPETEIVSALRFRKLWNSSHSTPAADLVNWSYLKVNVMRNVKNEIGLRFVFWHASFGIHTRAVYRPLRSRKKFQQMDVVLEEFPFNLECFFRDAISFRYVTHYYRLCISTWQSLHRSLEWYFETNDLIVTSDPQTYTIFF